METADSGSVSYIGADDNSALTLSTVMDGAAWTIQGVTPDREQSRMSEEGDGVWYARTANEYLHESINNWETPLEDLMRDCIFALSDLYATSVDNPAGLDPMTLPSAMITCTRYDEETDIIEYFNIGDTVCLVEREDRIDRVCATDASLSDPEFSADDQWRLSFQPEAIDYARRGTLSTNEVEALYLFPTAVDAAVEVYGMYPTVDAFVEDVTERGVEAVISDISTIYSDPHECGTLSTRPGVRDLSLITIQFEEIR